MYYVVGYYIFKYDLNKKKIQNEIEFNDLVIDIILYLDSIIVLTKE